MDTEKTTKTWSVPQVAAKLGAHRETIRKACERGDIPSTRIYDGGGPWRIAGWWLAERLAELEGHRK